MGSISFLQLNIGAWALWAAYWYISALFVNKTRSSEGWAARMQHLLPLALGFVLIFHDRHGRGWLWGRIYESQTAEAIGTALTVAGLLFAVWGRLHLGKYWSGIITLKEGHKLIRTGPYRFVRHPLYTGFLSAVLGSAITASTGDAFIGFVIMLVAYLIKMRREEKLLTGEFGQEYVAFKSQVWALLPFVY
jgi:protein-S-isoprenylcysteine O-methyltransferase Ste14